MSFLKYLSSIDVPDEIRVPFQQLEDIIQVEHGSDGKHPLATESQAGFATPDQVRKLNLIWDFFQKLQAGQSTQ